MKKLTLLVLVAVLAFCSCTESPKQSSYRTEWNADKNDSIVHIRYYNPQTNSFMEYYMYHMLFTHLFNSGGYNSVHNYYSNHQNEFKTPSYYSNYTPAVSHTVNTTSYSSPNRTYSSPSKSYSSPNRSYSSPSKSYSSPSRSYSSPSRSYSSPSRSYSSPSRSYSSPSRR